MAQIKQPLPKHLIQAIACLFLAVSVLVTANGPAHAENDGLPGVRGFFRGIFGVKKREKAPEATRQRKSRNSTVRRRDVASAPAEPQAPVVEKMENARKVLLVGDFLAGGVADGLQIAFAELPGVIVADKSSGSSGFVRDDHYNWPAEIGPMIEAEAPSIVVMMIGSNDRQQMQTDSAKLRLRSPEWDDEYQARIKLFAKAVKDRNIPLVWIGMPAFKTSSMTADMLAFNDFYKKTVEDNGGEFIDIWNGFVDESGAFATTGPDINGQPVRLRSSDGINLTKAGRRKVAFYAEKSLRKLLGDAANVNIGTLGPESLSTLTLDPLVGTPKVDRTNLIALTDPDLDGGDELLGEVAEPLTQLSLVPTPVQTLTIQGNAGQATPGRADDFTRHKSDQATSAPGLPMADAPKTAQ